MRAALAIFVAVIASGCAVTQPSIPEPPATAPASPAPVQTDRGASIAALAGQLVGSAYRFGGNGPREFDCSGLVTYVHAQLGILVPRTAAEQFLFATPVTREALRPGDLVFFRQSGPKVTHVGVYTGDGLFVHAPQSGRPVEYANLQSDYYRVNFAGAGRLHGRD